MKMKKLISAASALTLAASAFAGLAVTANAAVDVDLTPIATTQLNANDADTAQYNADATSWLTTQSSISGGKFKSNYVVITKIDASAYKDEIIKSATLSFTSQCTVADKNSRVDVAKINTDWDAETATWNNTNTAEVLAASTIFNNGANIGTTATTVTVDVTDLLRADEDKIVGFGIYTYTAREQQISNIKLNVQTSDAEMLAYTVNAVDESGNVLKEAIATGEAVGGSEYTVTGLPKVVESDGKFYEIDSAVSNYSVTYTMGTEAQTQNVTYTATDAMDYYIEGESLSTVTSASATSSNGAYGAVAGTKTASIGTYSAGIYTLTFYLSERGDRGVYVRDASNSDTSTNVIATANIDKNSASGVYTIDFVLTEETALAVSGYTASNGKTNQSAGIDYLYLKKTGEYVPTTIDVTKVSTNDDTSKTGAAKAFKAVGKVGTNDIKNVKWSIAVEGQDAATKDIAENIASGTEITYGLVVSAENVTIDKISDTAEVIYE
jgi:hypothetical protein